MGKQVNGPQLANKQTYFRSYKSLMGSTLIQLRLILYLKPLGGGKCLTIAVI